MNASILAERKDDGSKCFLCSVSLEDYVASLPKRYSDYEIQREIVTNVYLDRLVDTVLHLRHIPPIVLVVESGSYSRNGQSLRITKFNILDGLQRTHRLKVIRETIRLVDGLLLIDEEFLTWSSYKLSRQYSDELKRIESTIDVLKSIIEYRKAYPGAPLSKCFSENNQWFEIWTDLAPDQEVQKMLVLNAGHKPVKTRHQLELLFLNLLPLLDENNFKDFVLVREKHLSSTQFSKSREYGQFHFAHVIAALLSLAEGKPITTSTNLVQSLQEGDSPLSDSPELVSVTFLRKLVSFLLRLDKAVGDQFGAEGTLWIGREVALTGLFGAVGEQAKATNTSVTSTLDRLASILEEQPRILNLPDFEEQRNNLDLSRVNIGNVNKTAVFRAMKEVLSTTPPQKINWKRYFQGGSA